MGYNDHEYLSNTSPQVSYIVSKVGYLTVDELLLVLRDAAEYFKDDPNIPGEKYKEFVRL